MTTIELYRERHVIKLPRGTFDPAFGGMPDRWLRCTHCGIRIYAIRGGWRHDPAEVNAAARGER